MEPASPEPHRCLNRNEGAARKEKGRNEFGESNQQVFTTYSKEKLK